MQIGADGVAHVPGGATLQLSGRVRDFRALILARRGGPEELSTEQAARILGRSSRWWRDRW
jgi:hypothetical protein